MSGRLTPNIERKIKHARDRGQTPVGYAYHCYVAGYRGVRGCLTPTEQVELDELLAEQAASKARRDAERHAKRQAEIAEWRATLTPKQVAIKLQRSPELLTPEERAALAEYKARWAEPPTQKQLARLASYGCTTQPSTKRKASSLIWRIKKALAQYEQAEDKCVRLMADDRLAELGCSSLADRHALERATSIGMGGMRQFESQRKGTHP